MYCCRFSKERLIKKTISLVLILFISVTSAMEVPIHDFSITPYSQKISDYLPPDSADYSLPLLRPEYQATQLKQFFNHYYATDVMGLSPWSEQMVRSILPAGKKIELDILEDFDNQTKDPSHLHYAENFKEHGESWLSHLKQNMALDLLDSSDFTDKNKAIAIANTFARALPDAAPDFFHASFPGQGFPFDNLQESAIWSGTPLYVLSVSEDKAWSLVLTPEAYFAWVKSSDIAYASSNFISQWQDGARKGLVAITKTDTSVVNKQQHFQFTSYIGAVFPLVEQGEHTTTILIPIKNEHHQAVITIGMVNTRAASLMPLAASKKNIVNIIEQLQNRPYGWGGAFFFNDCSQEIKSIFTPLGIWLPRHSSYQAQVGATLDLSKNSVDERLHELKEKGHPLLTLISTPGHVMLYVGNKNTSKNEVEAITYQNVWGLSTANNDKRYVIGQSIFFPLLPSYQEHPDVNSQANKLGFKLTYLDALDTTGMSPQAFARHFIATSSRKQ